MAMTRSWHSPILRWKRAFVAPAVLMLAVVLQHAQSFSSLAKLPVRTRARPKGLRLAVEPSTAVPSDNAFRLVQYRGVVELQTATYKISPRRRVALDSPAGGASASATDGDDEQRGQMEVVLVSMVHLADQAYYREIMRDASSYDRVLFELIATPGVCSLDAGGRRAVTQYVYPTQEQVGVQPTYEYQYSTIQQGVPYSCQVSNCQALVSSTWNY